MLLKKQKKFVQKIYPTGREIFLKKKGKLKLKLKVRHQ